MTNSKGKFATGRRLAVSAAAAVSLMALSAPARTQQIVDPSAPLSKQPQIGASSTGIPQIDIATPEGGVSHNLFKSFGVDSKGVVINNSTAAGVSRVGGSVAANLNLMSSGPANVIVSEVNGTGPSNLAGAIEIFGSRADFILANPNGISCTGCAVLNANRAVLATGTPSIVNGNVEINITGGSLTVGGAGFSAPDGDAALLGRHVFLDGASSAFGDLLMSGGAQHYENASAKTRAAPALSGRQTPFAVDATALGAMNAGQIRIVGNEAGLGVRTHGRIKAAKSVSQPGNVSIAGSGDVSYFDIAADGSGKISGTGAVKQYGSATFGQAVSIATGSFNLIPGKVLSSQGDVSISAEDQVAVEGEVSGNDIRITAGKAVTNFGFILADGKAEVVAGDDVANMRRKLSGYTITYAPELAQYMPLIQTYRAQGGDLAAQVASWINQYEKKTLIDEHAVRGGTITGREVNAVAGRALVNTGGVIASTEDLTLTSGTSILNTYVKQLKVSAGDMAGGKHHEFHSGEILSGRKMKLSAVTDIVNEAGVLASYGDLALNAGGAVKNYVTASKYLVSDDRTLPPGSYISIFQQTRDEKLAFASGLVTSLAGNVDIKANAYDAIGSGLSAGKDVSIVTDGGVRMTHAVETLTDSVTTTHKSQGAKYCAKAGGKGGCIQSAYRTDTSTSTAPSTEVIVATSNVTGRNVAIVANRFDAPGIKIAAEQDLSIKVKQPLALTPGFSTPAGAVTIGQATGFDGWDPAYAGASSVFELEKFIYRVPAPGSAPATVASNLALALAGTDAADAATLADYTAFAESQRALRAAARLNAFGTAGPKSGAAIKQATRRVAAQSWTESQTGSGAVHDSTIVDGEESFTAALLKDAAGLPVTNPAFSNAMAWRFAADDGIANVLRSPDVVLYAGRDLLLSSSEGGLSYDGVGHANRDFSLYAGGGGLSAAGKGYGGRDVAMTARHDIALAAILNEGRDLYLTSREGGLAFGADLTIGRDLVVDTLGTVRNRAQLKARQSLAVTSRAGNIENLSTRAATASTPAEMTAVAGGLVLNAKGNILNTGSRITAGGSMLLTAGGDLVNESDAFKYVHQDFHKTDKDKTWYGKTTYTEQRLYGETAVIQPALVTAGGDMILNAGRDLINIGGTFRAGRTLDAAIGRDIVGSVASVELNFINYYSKSSSFVGYKFKGNYGSSEWNSFSTARAEFAGGNVKLAAGGDFTAHGATLSSAGSLSLKVAGEIGILPVQQVTYELLKSGKKSTFSKSSSASDTRRTGTQITSLDTTKDLSIVSTGSDITIQAGKLTAGGDLTIVAEKGRIAFLTATGTEVQQIKTDSSNLLWWQQRDQGYYLERIISSHLAAGGKLTVKGANGVIVEYDESKGSAADAIRQLSRAPELAWMAELRTRNDVQWRGVQGAYDQWDHKAEGLTQGGAAVIALAVTVATQGAASGFATAIVSSAGLSGSTAAVLSPAIQAGFQSIVSRAAVSLANNKGDVGKVLKELGSSASVKAVATSMVTAGLVTSLPADLAPTLTAAQAQTGTTLSLAQQLQANIVKGAIGASVSTAVNGGDLDRALLASLRSAGVSQVLAVVDTTIGDLTDGTGAHDLPVANMLAHAIAGGAAAKAAGGDFASGAAAGLASAVAANAGLFNGLSADKVSAISQLLGGTAAFLAGAGGDGVNAGADIASSAALNNFLSHQEKLDQLKAADQLAACRSGQANCSTATIESLQNEVSRLGALDELRDAALLSACSTGNRVDCGRWLQASYDALLTYPTAAGQYASSDAYLAWLGPKAREVFAALNAEAQQIDKLRLTVSDVIGQRECRELRLQIGSMAVGASAGGILAVANAPVPAALACAENPLCWNHVAITAGEIAAGDALGGSPISMTVATGGRIALQKGSEVLGLVDAGSGLRISGVEFTAFLRQDEAARLFSKGESRFDTIRIDGTYFAYDKTNTGGARIFDGVSEAQVKRYFEDLTGALLPEPMQMTMGAAAGIRYTTTTAHGSFTLRNLSSSAEATDAKWTIDVPNGVLGRGRDGVSEIKFR